MHGSIQFGYPARARALAGGGSAVCRNRRVEPERPSRAKRLTSVGPGGSSDGGHGRKRKLIPAVPGILQHFAVIECGEFQLQLVADCASHGEEARFVITGCLYLVARARFPTAEPGSSNCFQSLQPPVRFRFGSV